ncbi:pentatricopeptide repeat-containing protein At2g42920, chloroplastic [Syzygium oleosum]|uniref:pentatricopeptide repeat-containing protein At2g42920, chloroplastic n=1 Tax=Syzygium oleosum TaxID=219896 RepID=UPI0024B8BDEB|nr:pentatricopeptide repeat-containing protein At2g42920, chloroplastic [Syzygium oleosum]
MTPCETCCHSASPSTPTLVPDPHHYLALLDKRCATMRDLRILHAQLVKTGLSRRALPASRALAFCASPSGDIDYAWRLFSRTRRPNLFIWNTMIRGLSRSSTPEDAISLFIDMLVGSPIEPQRLTYPSVFKAYSQLGLARSGAQLHGRIVKLGLQDDPFIRNTVIHMYAHCGFLEEARLVFDGSSDCDVVAWNSMIMGLAKCGEIDEARRLFDQAPLRNAITWSSMASGYVRNGRFVDAMKLFEEMQGRGIEPNEFTLVSVLNASAHLGALKQGQWVHEYIKKSGTQLNAIVTTAIIDMYCRCGSIGTAYQVFRAATKRGLSCWNSMILGLARNGYAEEAISLFSQLESSDFKPDEVSFLGVLTACNHAGFIDEATKYLLLMMERPEVKPSIKHYSCMVDLLGRAGFLEEAEELIRSMPMDLDAIIWGSLLSGGANHRKADVAERAAKNMIELDPNESCAYVLMSNVLAGSNQHEEALEPRFSMKTRKIEKEPGASLIEVDGEVHEFVAGGRLHPRVEEIYCLLDELRLILQDVG